MDDRIDRCMNCGSRTPIDDLDGKPGPGVWMTDDLNRAADQGHDFDWLECQKCYGPNFNSVSAARATP